MKKIDILTILFVILGLVCCTALVHYSYAWAEEYSEALKYSLRAIGFAGLVGFGAFIRSQIHKNEQ